MFTKNYYKANACAVAPSGFTTAMKYTNCEGGLDTVYADSRSAQYVSLGYGVLRNAYNTGIVLGDGTAEPAITDYKLSGNLLTTISSLSDVTTFAEDDQGVTATRTLIVKNTGTQDITVSEIGWVGSGYVKSSALTAFLVERSLLPEPVTIAPGKSAQIAYTLRFAY